MCHASPVSQHGPLSRWRVTPSSTTRGLQVPRPHRAHRALRPVPSCPASPWQTCPCPHRAAPASAIACATTLTPTLHPPRRARSTYACKLEASRPLIKTLLTPLSFRESRHVAQIQKKCLILIWNLVGIPALALQSPLAMIRSVI